MSSIHLTVQFLLIMLVLMSLHQSIDLVNLKIKFRKQYDVNLIHLYIIEDSL